MTLQQYEYIVALDTHGNFVTAAEKCFVTQPTLSMQVQKLEEELGVILFDRSRQPVTPTDAGIAVVAQARHVLKEHYRILDIVQNLKNELKGELKVGIIPTLAPYLLPLFVTHFIRKHPGITLTIQELTTETIVQQLKQDQLDCGILATPIPTAPDLRETPLFYEVFVGYVSKKHPLFKKSTLTASDITGEDIWLLSEGHCLRSQILNFCTKHSAHHKMPGLNYESGSLETLRRMVDSGQGLTILPELSTQVFSTAQLAKVRYFRSPEPARQISTVTNRHYIKERLIQALNEAVLEAVPEKMKKQGKKEIMKMD